MAAIERSLERAHALITAAGGRLALQLATRKYRPGGASLAMRDCEDAVVILRRLTELRGADE